MGASCHRKGQDSLLRQEHVALELAAFVLRSDLIHNAGYLEFALAGNMRAHHDHIIELEILLR